MKEFSWCVLLGVLAWFVIGLNASAGDIDPQYRYHFFVLIFFAYSAALFKLVKTGDLNCEIPPVGEENETSLVRVWKPLPSRHVLKPWGVARKGKLKKDNIC